MNKLIVFLTTVITCSSLELHAGGLKGVFGALAQEALQNQIGGKNRRNDRNTVRSIPIPGFHTEGTSSFLGIEQQGEKIFQQFRRKAIRDQKVADYGNGLASEIRGTMSGWDGSYDITVINDPQVNAFAIPGEPIQIDEKTEQKHGHVVITTGLLRHIADTGNEATVAGIIGHELGHLALDHSGKSVKIALPIGIGKAIFDIITTDNHGGFTRRKYNPKNRNSSFPNRSEKSGWISIAADAGGGLLMGAISRSHENQSDEVGIGALLALHYDLSGFAKFFDGMPSGYMLGIPSFDSHPSAGSRAEKINEAAKQQDSSTLRANSEEFTGLLATFMKYRKNMK